MFITLLLRYTSSVFVSHNSIPLGILYPLCINPNCYLKRTCNICIITITITIMLLILYGNIIPLTLMAMSIQIYLRCLDIYNGEKVQRAIKKKQRKGAGFIPGSGAGWREGEGNFHRWGKTEHRPSKARRVWWKMWTVEREKGTTWKILSSQYLE